MKTDLIKIRPAVAMDGDDLRGVQRESLTSAYQGLIPHAELTELNTRRNRKWWARAITNRGLTLVLVFDEKIIGYAMLSRFRHQRLQKNWGSFGEVTELYLLPVL